MALSRILRSSALQIEEHSGIIGGKWVRAPASFPVVDPAVGTGGVLAHVGNFGADGVEQAIVAAESAFKTWKRTLAADRAEVRGAYMRTC